MMMTIGLGDVVVMNHDVRQETTWHDRLTEDLGIVVDVVPCPTTSDPSIALVWIF